MEVGSCMFMYLILSHLSSSFYRFQIIARAEVLAATAIFHHIPFYSIIFHIPSYSLMFSEILRLDLKMYHVHFEA